MPSIVNSTNVKHPNTFVLQKGDTSLVKEIKAISQSVRLLLTTARGELFGDPEFGCRLYEFIFEFEGEQLNYFIKQDIVETISKYESRIVVTEDDVSVEDDGVSVNIGIRYKLKNTNYWESLNQTISKERR